METIYTKSSMSGRFSALFGSCPLISVAALPASSACALLRWRASPSEPPRRVRRVVTGSKQTARAARGRHAAQSQQTTAAAAPSVAGAVDREECGRGGGVKRGGELATVGDWTRCLEVRQKLRDETGADHERPRWSVARRAVWWNSEPPGSDLVTSKSLLGAECG